MIESNANIHNQNLHIYFVTFIVLQRGLTISQNVSKASY